MIEQKVAIVTGSSKGIGLNIAECLLNDGFFVIITSRDENSAKKVAQTLDPNGTKTKGLSLDLTDAESAKNLIEETLSETGRIDVLINNALDNTAVIPLEKQTPELISSTINSNITNNMLLCHYAFPYLKEVKGNIVNIGSVVVNRHVLGLPLYSICKGAIGQMTKVLASEWANLGIRVNAVNPGVIYTTALKDLGIDDKTIENSYKHMEQFHPLGRIGDVQDIGKLVSFLCSDNALFITGESINADGGYSINGIPPYSGWTG